MLIVCSDLNNELSMALQNTDHYDSQLIHVHMITDCRHVLSNAVLRNWQQRSVMDELALPSYV